MRKKVHFPHALSLSLSLAKGSLYIAGFARSERSYNGLSCQLRGASSSQSLSIAASILTSAAAAAAAPPNARTRTRRSNMATPAYTWYIFLEVHLARKIIFFFRKYTICIRISFLGMVKSFIKDTKEKEMEKRVLYIILAGYFFEKSFYTKAVPGNCTLYLYRGWQYVIRSIKA